MFELIFKQSDVILHVIICFLMLSKFYNIYNIVFF